MTPVDEIKPPLAKLLIDKTFSLGLLILSSPVSLVIASSIAIENLVHPQSRAGIFHTERRVSAGRPFTLYKFRILKPSGEAAIRAGSIPKHVENDPTQLTSVGRVLKKIGLDEVPQLAMVLAGRMTLIGPRPKPIPEYEEEIERGNIFRARLRAGLSGPVQVQKGTVRTGEDALRADFDYMKLMESGSTTAVVKYDLATILKTVRVLFRATGE